MTTTATDFLSDIPTGTARAAYHGVSWNPEGRGDRSRQDYADTLAADYADLLAVAQQFGKADNLPDQFARFHDGCRKRYLAYLYSSARCVSWFIAGPSNFPAERMNKRADVCGRRLNEYFEYRAKVLAAIRRKLRPSSAISSDDADALEKLEIKIASLRALQDRMKLTNATIRRTKNAGHDAQVIALQSLGYPLGIACELLKPDFCGRIGYADYELTNNGANIRRLEGRLVEITRKRQAPSGEIEGTVARVELAPDENRVRVYLPGIPDADVRANLKRNGFRWAPSQGAWSAYHNASTVAIAQQVAGV